MGRLVVCQGTAQLVTAVSALRQHTQLTGVQPEEQQLSDHLVICGLAVPEQQVQAFSAVIERIAALLHPFASISRIDDPTLDRLIDGAKRCRDSKEIAGLLLNATGLGSMEEVFTARNWQACNELALCAYPDATHICYGDSVGVYLPRDYMSSNPTPLSWAMTQVSRMLPRSKRPMGNPRVDFNYLLLPDVFGTSPGELVQTNSATLRDLFSSLTPLLDVLELDDLRKKTFGRSVWVLMGSNFSEQGLMSPEEEISAYRDWIDALCPDPGAVLLLKSHPRDNEKKQTLLKQHLKGLFDEVWSADNVGSAYLPIEVLLLQLKLVVGSLRCLTVSTACLGTHFVVDSKTDIGFGDDLVSRYIDKDRRQKRMQHERDLRRICTF